MGNKGLFPVVAVPLAFFCTLFFRHRKKSVSAPWDGKSQSAPESARQAPTKGELLTAKLSPIDANRVAFRSPPCTPFGSPTETIERPIGLQALLPRRSRRVKPHRGRGYAPAGAPKGFPLALWKPSVATRSNRAPHMAASPSPAPESASSPAKGQGFAPAGALGAFVFPFICPFSAEQS